MTFLWLLVWVCSATPPVSHWNNWMIALAVCAGLDILGLLRRD